MKLEITRKSDLALRALRALAAGEGTWKAPELAKAIGTTPGFLTQALSPLVHRGWIQSSVGPTGGYRYAATRQPSLLEVIEAIEGPALDAACILPDGAACTAAASGVPCELHEGWAAASAAVLAMLAGTPAVTPCARRPLSDGPRSQRMPTAATASRAQ